MSTARVRAEVRAEAELEAIDRLEHQVLELSRERDHLTALVQRQDLELASGAAARRAAERRNEALSLENRALGSRVDELESSFARLALMLADMQSRLERAAEASSRAAADAAGEVAALQQHNHELTARVDALLVSTSWRLTAPLRWVVARWRRLPTLAALRRIARLAKPHALSMLTQPHRAPAKLRTLWQTWRDGGGTAIRSRLELAHELALGTCVVVTERRTDANGVRDAEFLRQVAVPGVPADLPALLPRVVVIVPVYRGVRESAECIESVLASRRLVRFELLVIDDKSPEVELVTYLESLRGRVDWLSVRCNPDNLGFVGTVVSGMAAIEDADVVLLNSDTVVGPGWLDRLATHAYSHPRVGTVTPFSNNATICSYPDLDGWTTLPRGETVATLDLAFAAANAGRSVALPTAVGFCMYIRRDCYADVGPFDAEAFGRGYGEENDFCLRATEKGWHHLLAGDVFVWHRGGTSFGLEAVHRKRIAAEIIRSRYPYYEKRVAEHVTMDAAGALRVAATARRFASGGLPVLLMVTHALGGGTEKHVRELIERLTGRARVLVLRPSPVTGARAVNLASAAAEDRLDLTLTSEDLSLLADAIRAFGVTRAHVHHMLGFTFAVEELLVALRVPYDLTIHDYYLICPRHNLFRPQIGYCGEPARGECNVCIRSVPLVGSHAEIVWWRMRAGSLVAGAGRVFCPSEDAQRRIAAYFPGCRALLVPHEDESPEAAQAVQARGLERGRSRVVALLGFLVEHKGLGLVRELLDSIRQQRLDLRIVLIGSSEGALSPSEEYEETGAYDDASLPGLIECHGPDVILFAAQAQETYSYSLSAAIRSGRPIVATDVGALPERMRRIPNARMVPRTIAGDELAHLLATMELRFLERGAEVSGSMANGYYGDAYLFTRDSAGVRTRPVIVLVPEMLGSVPSPCAYVRMLLPFSTRGARDAFEIRVASPEMALAMQADVFVTQRLAFRSVRDVDRLHAHARALDARIVYDIDDLLIALPTSHPEREHYAQYVPTIVKMLALADETWVSTRALQVQLEPFARSVACVPNRLYEDAIGAPMEPKARAESGTIRILYMGTATHDADLAVVLDALEKVNAEVPIELHLVGVPGPKPERPWIRRVEIPAEAMAYPLFMAWLKTLPEYHFAIAPLEDTVFNRCKSAIKFLDYTHLGLVTVASKLEPYACIEDGRNGWVADDDAQGWCAALHRAIAGRGRSVELLERARETARLMRNNGADDRSHVGALRALVASNGGPPGAEGSWCRNIHPSVDIDRRTLAAAFLDGEGIEIGALCDPLPVPSEARVLYVDRLSLEQQREHYPELGSASLVRPHLIADGESLAAIADESLDFVIANHFIEHAEDPIGAIESFLRVLRTGGIVYMAVPDKRSTFDRRRECTTLSHLMQDHVAGAHETRAQHYDEWVSQVEAELGRTYGEADRAARVGDLMAQRYSIHFHCWDPAAFSDLLRHLHEELALPFEPRAFVERRDEFVVILVKR